MMAFLLTWSLGEEEPHQVVFKYTNETSMRNARKKMVARMAVIRAVSPDTKFKGYNITSERLDWIK